MNKKIILILLIGIILGTTLVLAFDFIEIFPLQPVTVDDDSFSGFHARQVQDGEEKQWFRFLVDFDNGTVNFDVFLFEDGTYKVRVKK